MFTRTNIKEKLITYRDKRVDEREILKEVYHVFSENEAHRKAIQSRLKEESSSKTNQVNFDLLETEKIFHISDIEAICMTYRLRFLDSKYFKGNIPEEAISKIRALENRHKTTLKHFKIVAPAKLMKLENADDPLLFTPLGNDYYYLIHKWGRDLHPFRKWLMWPFRSLDNIAICIALISFLITAMLPLHLFTNEPGPGEYFFTFLYTFNALGGLALLWGVSKGKNFNNLVWRSTYYNG